ncbi:MAG: hypothetical protein JWR39_254, partial [Devosia sp.]|nr:hypothetical protein [Devosia sp.]
MSLRIPTNRGIAALAAAAMLTVTLPAGSALAQKIKNPAPEVVEPATKQVATAHRVEIDTITAVDANLDEATLRDIFSGNIEGNAQALATLSATSITIPRIDIAVEADSGEEGKPIQTTIVLSDLVLTDVVDGVAATVSLSSTAVSSGDNGSAEIGTIAAKTLDIGGILGLYGLIEADPSQALATIYTDFSFDGGSIETPEVSCTLGSITVAELKARPLQHTMGEMMALSEAMDAQEEDEQPSPEIVGAALRMYADILTAFETSPVEFGGFECDGVDEEDRPLAVAVEGMSMGGMRPGIYPQITLDGMSIAVEGDGSIGVGRAVLKQFDLSGSIAAIQNAPETIDQAWLDANARALVPAFSGFSFDQVSVDVPDP